MEARMESNIERMKQYQTEGKRDSLKIFNVLAAIMAAAIVLAIFGWKIWENLSGFSSM